MTAGVVPFPIVLGVAAAFVLLCVIVVASAIIAWRAGLFKRADPAAPDPEAEAADPLAPVTRAVREAVAELAVLTSDGSAAASQPWVMILGAGGEELQALKPPPTARGRGPVQWLDQKVNGVAGTLSFHDHGVIVGFPDGLLGDAHWRPRLVSLLRALDHRKPGRPIDALVVVAPYALLAAEDGAGLARRAAAAYEAILTIQQRTGWRLPIHVVVSGCPPSFRDLRESTDPAGQPPLGWFVPYALDTVFQPAWIDEAVDAMVRAQSERTFYLLATGRAAESPEAREAIFLFPGRLRQLQPALVALLTGMMRKSAYHEAFMLRSVFLLADRRPTPASPRSQGQVLLEDKVFAEGALAQPALGAMTRRHRQIRTAQWMLAALLALFAAGLWEVADFGRTAVRPIQRLLCEVYSEAAETPGDLHYCQVAPAGSELTDDAARRQRTIELLNYMARVNSDTLSTPFAPLSLLWEGAYDRKVTGAIKTGLAHTGFRLISKQLTTEEGIEALLTRGADPADPLAAWKRAAQNYRNYVNYFSQAFDIQQSRNIENNSVAMQTLQEFAGVVDYTIEYKLPDSFAHDSALYAPSVIGAPILQRRTPADVSPAVRSVVGRMFQTTICELYVRTPLEAQLHPDMAGRPCGADAPEPTTGTGAADASVWVTVDDIESGSLLDRLDAVQRELARKGVYDWIFDEQAPGRPDQILANMAGYTGAHGVQLLQPADFTTFAASAELDEKDARRRLKLAAIDGQPVLTDDSGHAALSKPMRQAQSTLRSLYSQPFMAPIDAAAPLAAGPVHWDLRQLAKAQEITEAYATFVAPLTGPDDDPDAMSPSLRGVIRQAAAARFAARAIVLVDTAASPAPSLGPADERQDMVSALPYLVQARAALREAGATAAAQRLSERLSARAYTLLEDVDRQLGSLYAIDAYALSPWPEDGQVAERAFRADNPDDLAVVLKAKRAQVARLAGPETRRLVDFLSAPEDRPSKAASALAHRWRKIIAALDAADRRDADSSVLRLEQFILTDMDKVGPLACPRYGRGKGADYFDQALQTLRASLIWACRESLGVSYAALESDFNGVSPVHEAGAAKAHFDLAGHFPFDASGGANGAAPADPVAVRQFFDKWGALLGPMSDWLKADRTHALARREAAIAFLESLTAARRALGPMLTGAQDALLAYHVTVEFFSDTTVGVEQDQIGYASIAAGDAAGASRVCFRSPPLPDCPAGGAGFDWINGQPINLTLRWAENAANLPAGAQPMGWPEAAVDGLYARYRVAGSWALLRLLTRAGAAAGNLHAGPGAIVLQARLAPNPAAATANAARAQAAARRDRGARVFLRLSLATPAGVAGQGEKSTPVTLPVFPEVAPDLGETVAATR